MCELCSTNPIKLEAARENTAIFAEKLKRAADIHEKLADGSLKPHTEEFKQYVPLFKLIIRTLVNDYI